MSLLLDRITTVHGRLSDLKAVWWPFLCLKPIAACAPITRRRVAIMVPCFAAWLLIGWLLRELLLGRIATVRASDIVIAYGWMLLGFTLWFNLVTAPLWNRRARQLQLDQSCSANVTS